MIITKTAKKRQERDKKIIDRYNDLIKGSMKSAVYEQIATELKTSVTTVSRIVKGSLA